MKVPGFKRLNKGDVPGLPEGFYTFMDHIQEQVDLVSQAVGGRLTILENFRSEPYRTVQLKHNVLYTLKLQSLKSSPSGILVLESAVPTVGQYWERLGQDKIAVKLLFDGAPTDPVEVVITILG